MSDQDTNRENIDVPKLQREHEAMNLLGQTILDLQVKIERKDSEIAVIESNLKREREQRRQLDDQKDEAAGQLALIAAGKNPELLPIRGTAGAITPVLPAITSGDAWRTVRIDALKRPKPLTKGKLEILAGLEPPIVTLGDLATYQQRKGQWWARDLKGFGEKGKQITDDLWSQYFVENPQPGATPAAQSAAGQPDATAPAPDPDTCSALAWSATAPNVKRAPACAGSDTEPFYFEIQDNGGLQQIGGSPELLYDPAPPTFTSDTAAVQWCNERNAEVFAMTADEPAKAAPAASAAASPTPAEPATPATGTPAPAPATGPRLANSGPAVSEDRAAESLGLTGRLSDPHYAALRVGMQHATGIIQGLEFNISQDLFGLGLVCPDDMGEPRITDLGVAALGYQPELDSEVARLRGQNGQPPRPAPAPPAPAPAAEPPQPKRGRGRPKGAPNKPKAGLDQPSAAAN